MIKALDLRYLKHFFHYASAYKKSAAIGLAMLPLSIATNLLFPWFIIKVIDNHLAVGVYQGLYQLIGLLVLVLIMNYIADAFYSYYLRSVWILPGMCRNGRKSTRSCLVVPYISISKTICCILTAPAYRGRWCIPSTP